eukprot:42403-Pleurochrysis_carterae.AAC.2
MAAPKAATSRRMDSNAHVEIWRDWPNARSSSRERVTRGATSGATWSSVEIRAQRRSLVSAIGVVRRGGVGLRALRVKALFTSGAEVRGVVLRGGIGLRALRVSLGTRALGGDVSGAHQRVHGWPRQSDAQRRGCV